MISRFIRWWNSADRLVALMAADYELDRLEARVLVLLADLWHRARRRNRFTDRN